MAQIQNIYDVLLRPHRDRIEKTNDETTCKYLLIIGINIYGMILKYGKFFFCNEAHDRKADSASSGINVFVEIAGKVHLELETALLVYALTIIWKQSRSAKMIFFKITFFGVLSLSLFSDAVIIFVLSMGSYTKRMILLAVVFLEGKYGSGRSYYALMGYITVKTTVSVLASYVIWFELYWWLYVKRNAPEIYRRQAALAPQPPAVSAA